MKYCYNKNNNIFYGKTKKCDIQCTNCGKHGHESKKCTDPITSYGIINCDIIGDGNEKTILKDKFSSKKPLCYKIISKNNPDISCFISEYNKSKNCDNTTYKLHDNIISYLSDDHVRKFCYYKDKIIFMMVSRKFSIGFTEFIRGKYDVSNSDTVIKLFKQMYCEEIKYISKNSYDNMLYYFCNRNNQPKELVLNNIYEGKYSHEYCEAKLKFNMLRDQTSSDDIPFNLSFYVNNIKPKWDKHEWGFPKGRLDCQFEEKIKCAQREFEEETGYKTSEYDVLNKIEPINELMIGTNGVKYKHIYYLALNNRNIYDQFDNYDVYETGEIKWFTYEEAIATIRPYHIEKKDVLTKVYLFILNYLIHNNYEIMND